MFRSSPEALQCRVDFKGLTDLVNAFSSVFAHPIPFIIVIITATELVGAQPAVLSEFSLILSRARKKFEETLPFLDVYFGVQIIT